MPVRKIRNTGWFAAILVCICISFCPNGALARGENGLWGALAVNKASPNHYGWSVRKQTQSAAEEAALEYCTGNCEIVLVLNNQCGAYAQGENGGFGFGTGPGKASVLDVAMQNCQAHDRQCRVAVWACSTLPGINEDPVRRELIEEDAQERLRLERIEHEEREERERMREREERRAYEERERSEYRSSSSFIDRLSDIQRKALADGCEYRYNAVPSKLRACLNGTGGNYEEALVQGCQLRYSGAPEKLSRCLRN